jgi:hypothetical protein
VFVCVYIYLDLCNDQGRKMSEFHTKQSHRTPLVVAALGLRNWATGCCLGLLETSMCSWAVGTRAGASTFPPFFEPPFFLGTDIQKMVSLCSKRKEEQGLPREGGNHNYKTPYQKQSLPLLTHECEQELFFSLFLVFSLSSHRHSYISLIFTSHCIDS